MTTKRHRACRRNDSHEESLVVAIEIRAEEIAAKIAALPGASSTSMSAHESRGMKLHLGAIQDSGSVGPGEQAGFLSREILTHEDRAFRDKDAWPWDPTRPVAGQYQAWLKREIDLPTRPAIAYPPRAISRVLDHNRSATPRYELRSVSAFDDQVSLEIWDGKGRHAEVQLDTAQIWDLLAELLLLVTPGRPTERSADLARELSNGLMVKESLRKANISR